MLYDIKAAMQILQVCRKTIERAINEDRLKCRRIGGMIRFTQHDLEQFVGAPLFNAVEPPKENEGVIPPEIIKTLEAEIAGVKHGLVNLTVHLRDNRPRFVIGRERSYLPDTDGGIVCEKEPDKQ
jgi:hypothetical protein